MNVLTFTCTLAIPPRKRPRAEKTMEKAWESFMEYQRDADEQYQKCEEERWQRDVELEEKRRKVDRSMTLGLCRC